MTSTFNAGSGLTNEPTRAYAARGITGERRQSELFVIESGQLSVSTTVDNTRNLQRLSNMPEPFDYALSHSICFFRNIKTKPSPEIKL